MHHLVGVAEIVDMLGVSRQMVHKLLRRPDFPQPVAVLRPKGMRIWAREDVVAWIVASGRNQPDEP